MDSIPIQINIRKIIFDNFNDIDGKFTNDEIFNILKKTNQIDSSLTIDDTEKYFLELCDTGLARNIAQNFTTIWFKLFEPLEKIHCDKCNLDVFLGMSEKRICPNPECKALI